MPAGCEFHTEGSATLKPREAKVVWTRGTDNRLVQEESREHAGMCNNNNNNNNDTATYNAP